VVGLALGGHREHVADEELGHELLVVVVHLHRAVDPADALLDRGLGLDQHEWETVDQQHQIGPALSRSCSVNELLGDDVLVLLRIVQVEQPYRHMLVAGAEGHGAFATHPRGHFLIGTDKAIQAH